MDGHYLRGMSDLNTIKRQLQRQKALYSSGITRPYKYRKRQLIKLKQAIKENEGAVLEALKQDLAKSSSEAYVSEVGFIYNELNDAIKNLKYWVRDEATPTSLLHFPSRSFIRKSPYGLCLIIGPWNYPFQLLISPLIASIAAGNVSTLKPSEFAPQTAAILDQILTNSFDPDYISLYPGPGHEITPKLMRAVRFDKIFFTGSTQVGKILAVEAAKSLIPITLELGGKCPAIVDDTANIHVAAKRIIWGKFYNAGQTCVSPDYVLVHKNVVGSLTEAMVKAIKQFYTDQPLQSDDLGKMIHKKHFDTMRSYLNEADIFYGGKSDEKKLKISPTLVLLDHTDVSMMQQEIFGPILPIIPYHSVEKIDQIIAKSPNPLALYVFSQRRAFQNKMIDRYAFGGACINNTLIHLNNPHLPFGGTGESGKGYYHGRWGFQEFSLLKAVCKTGTWLDIPLKYPPYDAYKFRLFKKLIR